MERLIILVQFFFQRRRREKLVEEQITNHYILQREWCITLTHLPFYIFFCNNEVQFLTSVRNIQEFVSFQNLTFFPF